jgi:hypothetical protein
LVNFAHLIFPLSMRSGIAASYFDIFRLLD